MLQMGASEFEGWRLYHEHIPFRAERQDILMAEYLTIYVNAHLPEDVEPRKTLDFLPWMTPLEERPKQPVPEVEETSMKTAALDKVINAGKAVLKAKLAKAPKG